MTNPNSGNIPMSSPEQHWPTTVAALAVGTAFFSLWFWLLPQWLGFRVEMAGAAPWRLVSTLPSLLGVAVVPPCGLGFCWAWPRASAPVAPPPRLVVVGFYRHVRNPMYVGFAVGWIGLWIVFGHANLLSIAGVAAVALGVHLFVILYEEPTLRRKFGADYEAYCRNVSRWWPRLKG